MEFGEMKEHIALLESQRLPVPPPSANPTITIQNTMQSAAV